MPRKTLQGNIDPAEHVGIVYAIAATLRKKMPPHVDVDDLVGDGMVGLLQAAAAFDPAKGVSFASYAGRRVRGAMLDGLRDRDHISRSHRARLAAAGRDAPRVVSIDAPMARDGDGHVADLGEMLSDVRHREKHIAASGQLAELLAPLGCLERVVLRLRYGHGWSLLDIGEFVGLSESRIQQISKASMARLRDAAGLDGS